MAPSPNDIPIFPHSAATVSVKALVAFPRLVGDPETFVTPAPETAPAAGAPAPFAAPGYSFLIENPASGRRVVFDLGVRKDADGASPAMKMDVEEFDVTVEQDISEQLRAGGVDLASVEAIIWSHSHFDHIGDPNTFPKSTAIVVGPGTKAAVMPGYPADPNGLYLESDFADREVREISFEGASQIGGFPAYDYFGDGSLWLLSTPGHCVGHMCALARVTDAPTPSYVLLAGDAAHHPAILRPSPLMPLPTTRRESLPDALKPVGFPSYTHPFLHPGSNAHANHAHAALTLQGLLAFDSRNDVLLVLAHDASLGSVVQTFPQEMNKWMTSAWKEKTIWAFLDDGNPGNRWTATEGGDK